MTRFTLIVVLCIGCVLLSFGTAARITATTPAELLQQLAAQISEKNNALRRESNTDVASRFREMRTRLPEALQVGQSHCELCKLAIEGSRWILTLDAIETFVDKFSVYFCTVFKIEDTHVCQDVISEYTDLFMYIAANQVLEPNYACGMLGFCPKPATSSWNVTFTSPAPPIKPYPQVATNGTRIYMLHFSDAHIDPLYTPGLDTNCGEPICCRPPNSPGKNASTSAGPWGDYNCDAPKALWENMLAFIKEKVHPVTPLKYAIFTGDIPPHDVWDVSRDSAVTMEQYLADTFKATFADVPLFPAVGNHETVPVNQFAPRNVSGEFDMGWLYSSLAERWAYWLPADAVESVRYAGYYTALASSGVRIVSLNTNQGCNGGNWFFKFATANPSDPDNQLHWFAQVMDAAEKANEYVYIIKHVTASEGNCGMEWWTNYWKIIQRYQNIILGDFAGHTHDDIFAVTYAYNNDSSVNPLMTTYYPGSVTPYQPENPGFRVYEIDAATNAIVDFTEYALNLTQANIDNNPKWFIEYQARSAYQLPDMSPASWHAASLNFKTNQTMMQQYLLRRAKGNSEGPCDDNCVHGVWCSLWNGPPNSPGMCGV